MFNPWQYQALLTRNHMSPDKPKFVVNWWKVGFTIFEIVLFAVFGYFMAQYGRSEGVNEVQKQAVEQGHGTYETTPDKIITFKWKTLEPTTKRPDGSR